MICTGGLKKIGVRKQFCYHWTTSKLFVLIVSDLWIHEIQTTLLIAAGTNLVLESPLSRVSAEED